MKPRVLAFCLAALPLLAWGDKGHRTVVTLSLTTLPPDLRAWYQGRETYLRDHASDPDHWRDDRKEPPRHFLDSEPYGGPAGVPRDVQQAQAKLGGQFYRNGVVLWVIQDRWRDLVAAFQSRDPERVAFATSILSHYIADLHVPLHTTENHDGEETGQRGVHSRWETGLVGRFVEENTLTAPAAQVDPHILDRPWEWLAASNALVPKVLADDRAADRTSPENARGRQRTPAYWMLFWSAEGPVVKGQLERAAQHLGDAVLTAWARAGRPQFAPPATGK
ncbi:MAG TPA: S1/P1 nuclease [Holophagaceae bacterium]